MSVIQYKFNPKISVLFERTSTSNPGPKLFKLGTGHRKMKIDAFHFHSHLERKANRVYAADTERVRQQCQSVTKSCGECISKHSDCAWCSDPVGCYLFYSFLLLTILRDHQSVLGWEGSNPSIYLNQVQVQRTELELTLIRFNWISS